MSSSFSYHENDNSNSIAASHPPTESFYFNPHQFVTSGPDFMSIPTVDPSLVASSIYDTQPAAPMAPLCINPNINIPSSWPAPQDAIYSASYSPTFSPNDPSVDPRSLEGFDMLGTSSATTLGDESQTSSHLIRSNSASSSLHSAITSPPPDSPPMKKRRGRRPKALATYSANTSSSSSRSTVAQQTTATSSSNKRGASANDAKQVALERNRIAAAKCRSRRNAAESELTTHEREVEDRNCELKADCGALRQEILSLKAEIHNHANCDCDLIQQYLTNEAKRYVTEGGGAEFSNLLGGEGMSPT